jgi:hypothetical protein
MTKSFLISIRTENAKEALIILINKNDRKIFAVLGKSMHKNAKQR